MILPIPIRSEFFDLSAAAPTAIQPGEAWAVNLELTARRKITLAQLHWTIPEELSLRLVSGPGDFPRRYLAI